MKIFTFNFVVATSFLIWLNAAQSQTPDARFFRMTGPVPSKITAFSPDGNISWTNTPTNAIFKVQAVTTLGGSNWVDYAQIPVTNGFNTSKVIDPKPPVGMVLIPAGSFTMGNCMDTNEGFNGELPLHTVYVSSFYMDRYDVTYALWTNVYNWATNHGYSFTNAGSGKAANHPVQNITWHAAVKWCNARSEMEGKVPAYYTNAAQTVVYRNGQVDLTNTCVNWNAGYRLPTEAEWEKAARGGRSGLRFPWGNTITESQANYYAQPSSYAYDLNSYSGYNTNYADGFSPYTSPVGSFAPNGYGLHDMAGNGWQWCWDWYGGSSGSASQTDPRGPTSGTSRVFRGGSLGAVAIWCRVAAHVGSHPDNSASFRTVLPSGQ